PRQTTTMMKSSLCFSLCLLLGLAAKPALTLSLVNNCSFSVHMPELRRYYSEIRLKAVRLSRCTPLQKKNPIDDQTCCFLRLLLRFYVERVFRNFAGDQPQEQRSCSALANAFVAMKRNINKCVTPFFFNLSTDKAAKKAVAELDTLLDWLDEVDQASAPK
uniref:Interleukin-20-like n=1 Tax=Hippocampus comes TaxID=109280 RepID=A0A3Q2YTM4_HIPCM